MAGARSPKVLRTVCCGVLALTFATGCASGPVGVSDALRHGRLADALAAYDRGRPDLGSLQRIAVLSLEQQAQSRDPRLGAPALAALGLSNTLAERALGRLAVRAKDPGTRAQALALLARLGDRAAREQLRGKLDDADASVRAAAVEALDPEADAAALRALCDAPASATRLAAVQKLARATPSAETMQLLVRVARLDPALRVRVAALLGLGRQGPAAADAIEGLLEDTEPAVRLAAMSELAQVDRARASSRLAPYLSGNPTPEGVEAARVLLSDVTEPTAAAARSQLERALTHRDNAVRAAAAVALMSLRGPQLAALAQARVEHEAVRSVRLCLALALGAERADGRASLTALTRARDLVSAQAAAELARRGDAAALGILLGLRQSRDAVVRRVAVRALAQELGRANEVRAALLDADPGVRIAAASAILAAKG
jgi:ParB family chromosome partitioning protein